MSREPDVRVACIGPKGSGKTHMLAVLPAAVQERGHGYPAALNVSLEAVRIDGARTAADRLKERLSRGYRHKHDELAGRAARGQVVATDTGIVDDQIFDLRFRDVENGDFPRECRIVIGDAAGEHIFRPAVLPHEDSTRDIREQVVDQLVRAAGIVVAVPCFKAANDRFLQQLLDLVSDLASDSSPPTPLNDITPAPHPRRIAVALNHYDTLFTSLGNEAWAVAANPAVARNIVKSLLGDKPQLRRLLRSDRAQGGSFDIAFVPTSSFGFLPEFGCPNIDPDDDEFKPTEDKSPGPFARLEEGDKAREFYPFLTADPFIYAATGLANPYIVSLADVLGVTARRDDRLGRADPGPAAADWPPFRPESGGAAPPDEKPGGGDGREERDGPSLSDGLVKVGRTVQRFIKDFSQT